MVHFCHTLLKGIITEVHCKDRGKLQLCCHPVTTHWFTDDGVSPVLGRLLATKPCISQITGSLCLLCCLLLLWLVVVVGWCGGAPLVPVQSLLHSWLGKIHTAPQYTVLARTLHQPDTLVSSALLPLSESWYCSTSWPGGCPMSNLMRPILLLLWLLIKCLIISFSV